MRGPWRTDANRRGRALAAEERPHDLDGEQGAAECGEPALGSWWSHDVSVDALDAVLLLGIDIRAEEVVQHVDRSLVGGVRPAGDVVPPAVADEVHLLARDRVLRPGEEAVVGDPARQG